MNTKYSKRNKQEYVETVLIPAILTTESKVKITKHSQMGCLVFNITKPVVYKGESYNNVYGIPFWEGSKWIEIVLQDDLGESGADFSLSFKFTYDTQTDVINYVRTVNEWIVSHTH